MFEVVGDLVIWVVLRKEKGIICIFVEVVVFRSLVFGLVLFGYELLVIFKVGVLGICFGFGFFYFFVIFYRGE